MKLHVFDLDKTLLSKNVSFSFYFHLIKQGIVPKSNIFRTIPFFFLRPGLEAIHRYVFRHVLKGLSLQLLHLEGEKFLDANLASLLCPKVFSHLVAAKRRSEALILLSSSPLFLVEKIAKRFSFEHWAGTEYAVDKEGKICEITTLITGTRKKEIAGRFAGQSAEKIVYTDSLEDLPLLEWADVAMVVRPCNTLRKIALSRSWNLI